MSDIQKRTLAEASSEDPPWICRVTFPAPVDAENIRALIERAIATLGDQGGTIAYCPVQSVDARWISHRTGDDLKDQPNHSLSADERYRVMMSQTDDIPTIMYFHGGGFLFISLNPPIISSDSM